jgi:hypothetical protein
VPLPEPGGQDEDGFQSHFFRLKKSNIAATIRMQTHQKKM